jgi:branched-subunit amino acid aminotransferase/4-amino-4-deoxychorismate lyase
MDTEITSLQIPWEQSEVAGDRIAYFNGSFVPERYVAISIYDRGFTLGDAVFDVARTYGLRPYKYKEHVERLVASLRYLRIDPLLTAEEMLNIAVEVTRRNTLGLDPAYDLRMVWRVSRGLDKTGLGVPRPTVLIHNDPIPWRSMAQRYTEGGHLVVVNTRALDPQNVDPKAKIQSRLAYVMADLEAQQVEPGATGLMLDPRGCLAEATRANVFLVRDGVLLTSKCGHALRGVSRATILEMAADQGIPAVEDDLYVYDLLNADEVFLAVTSPFIEPISRVNTVRPRQACPGPVTKRLIAAFSEQVGVDIIQQALWNSAGSKI